MTNPDLVRYSVVQTHTQNGVAQIRNIEPRDLTAGDENFLVATFYRTVWYRAGKVHCATDSDIEQCGTDPDVEQCYTNPDIEPGDPIAGHEDLIVADGLQHDVNVLGRGYFDGRRLEVFHFVQQAVSPRLTHQDLDVWPRLKAGLLLH